MEEVRGHWYRFSPLGAFGALSYSHALSRPGRCQNGSGISAVPGLLPLARFHSAQSADGRFATDGRRALEALLEYLLWLKQKKCAQAEVSLRPSKSARTTNAPSSCCWAGVNLSHICLASNVGSRTFSLGLFSCRGRFLVKNL
jgi:hypothetical protein